MRAILRAHHGEFGGFGNQIVGQGTGFSGGDQIVGNGFNQFTKRFRTHSPSVPGTLTANVRFMHRRGIGRRHAWERSSSSGDENGSGSP